MRRPAVWLLAILPLAGQESAPAQLSQEQQERAIAAIHRRAEGVSRGTRGARRIAAELEEIGRDCLARGQIGQAIELLGEALALDEDNGVVLAELTLSYVRIEDYEAAAFYLRLAEDRATRAPPEIYAVLGAIYDSLHRLDDAVAAWSESVRLGGQEATLLRRLARARDELALARGQRSVVSESFTIFAEPAVPEELARATAQMLEATHRDLAAFLGARLPAGQVVVLYVGRSYFSLACAPDWVSGVYDGKIRLSVEPDSGTPEVFAAVMAHELAHALIRHVSRDRAPGWFHEGLAQWLEGRRIPRWEIRWVMGAHPTQSIEALEAGLASVLDRAQARALYAESLSLIEYLAAIRGEGVLACIVARLGEASSLSEALRAETGLSPGELYSGWRSWAGL